MPPDGRKELAAAELLADLGPDALPVVLAALDDRYQDVRLAAIVACGMVHDPRAIAPLGRFVGSPDPIVAIRALRALEEFGPAGAAAIRSALTADNPTVAGEAAIALATVCGEKAIPEILANTGKSDSVWAAQSLAQCGPTAVPALLALLRTEKDNGARCSIVNALECLHDRRAVEPLVSVLTVGERGVAGAAATALGNIGDVRALPALLKAAENRSSGCQVDAVTVLGRFKDPRVMATLYFCLLRSDDDRVVEAAANSLAEIGDPQSIPALLDALKPRERDEVLFKARGRRLRSGQNGAARRSGLLGPAASIHG